MAISLLLHDDAMYKRGLCRHAVSVRLSITCVYSVEMIKHIFNFFSPSSFSTPNVMAVLQQEL